MPATNRDRDIIEHILRYCNQVETAHADFCHSKDRFCEAHFQGSCAGSMRKERLKMRKIVALVMIFALLLVCVPAMAEGEPEYKNVKIEVNGERIILLDAEEEQQKSIIVDGKVYVPIECFISAIGGEITYDETANQITITLASSENNTADGSSDVSGATYSDADIAAILTAGRWSRTTERGTSFFDFSSDNTGKISGMLACTWAVNDGV